MPPCEQGAAYVLPQARVFQWTPHDHTRLPHHVAWPLSATFIGRAISISRARRQSFTSHYLHEMPSQVGHAPRANALGCPKQSKKSQHGDAERERAGAMRQRPRLAWEVGLAKHTNKESKARDAAR